MEAKDSEISFTVAKSRFWKAQTSSVGSRGEFTPCLVQLLVAVSIPQVMAEETSAFSSPVCVIFLPASLS